jgi:hypothetical protein
VSAVVATLRSFLCRTAKLSRTVYICSLMLRADSRCACFDVEPVAEWVVACVIIGAFGEDSRNRRVGGSAIQGG